VVSRSLVKLIKSHPKIGWDRGDSVPDEGAAQEILRLRRQIEGLERMLSESRISAPPGTENLAQGEDRINVQYIFVARKSYSGRHKYRGNVTISWNTIFGAVSPAMIDEIGDDNFRQAVNHLIERETYREHQKDPKLKGYSLGESAISDTDFQTLKVQLRALGLIDKSTRSRSVKDTTTYWTLTPYGDNVMNKLRVIRRDDLLSNARE
jgi:hypothetical protein